MSVSKMGALACLSHRDSARQVCGGRVSAPGRTSLGGPGAGRTRLLSQASCQRPGLGFRLLPGFPYPFRVIPGPAGSFARSRRKLRKLRLPEPQVGRAGGAQASGAGAARYVRTCVGGAQPEVGGVPSTPPPRDGGNGAGIYLSASRGPRGSCRSLPHLRSRPTRTQRGGEWQGSHSALLTVPPSPATGIPQACPELRESKSQTGDLSFP